MENIEWNVFFVWFDETVKLIKKIHNVSGEKMIYYQFCRKIFTTRPIKY